MKGNVDLTEPGYFSEGWMPGGWMAKGVFRKRKTMKTSKKFKEILRMGDDKTYKPYNVSSIIAKLFGLKTPIIWNGGNSIDYGGQAVTLQSTDWAITSTATTNGTWISTDVAL